jgi:cysteinyl-tRNA synthetase
VEEALAQYSADSLRMYFLSSHYRSPLQYTDEGSAAMERSMDRLRHALRPSDNSGESLEVKEYRQRFLAAMDEDLNTPQALAAMFDLAREINRGREAGRSIDQAQQTLRDLGGILGIVFEDPDASGQDQLAAKPFIDLLVHTRTELRQAKQWALADQIRDQLAEQGVVLEDTPQGTEWQYHR